PTRHLKHTGRDRNRRDTQPKDTETTAGKGTECTEAPCTESTDCTEAPCTEAPGDHRGPQWQGAGSGRHGQRAFGPGLRASRIGAVEHGDAGGDRGREPDHMEGDEYLGHTEEVLHIADQ